MHNFLSIMKKHFLSVGDSVEKEVNVVRAYLFT